jgi:RimJ/RimL family protein N-acetyltransferase
VPPRNPAHTRVYVTSLQAVIDRAEANGARIVTEPRELPFGDIVARFRDPQGHLWWVHQHVEDVGLAAWALRAILPRALGLGLERLLVTCADVNLASARTIEKVGGMLEDVRETEPGLTRRYWILL